MNFRAVPGRQLTYVNVGREFSNFQLVDDEFHSAIVMRRIMSLARKLEYQSLLVDEINEADCALLQEENAALKQRVRNYSHSRVRRLCFFSVVKGEAPPPPEALLGYAVFKEDFAKRKKEPFCFHVYESVIRPHREFDDNNFIHCSRKYTITTSLGSYQLPGILYAQQNNLTFVCAHVALRIALAAVLDEADITYGEINRILGIDHITHRVGGGVGLGPAEIKRVLEDKGVFFQLKTHEPSKRGAQIKHDYQRYLYGAVECGMPAFIGFETKKKRRGPTRKKKKPRLRHMICTFGHTFNEDSWVPAAQPSYFAKGKGLGYYPSESWLSSFVIHDDNFGPYQCVPRHYLTKTHLRIIICLQRHDVDLTNVEAEAIGFSAITIIRELYHTEKSYWYDRFWEFGKHSGLILRTQVIRKAEYIAHLNKLGAWEGQVLSDAQIHKLTDDLPDWFWLVEVSALELFQVSRRKLGEVLLACQARAGQSSVEQYLLAARLPTALFLPGGKLDAPEPSPIAGHTDLFSRTSVI